MDERCLLIIEDDPGLQSQLRWSFDDITVDVADSREQALAILNENPKPVVTLDLGLPPDPGGTTEGFALLREIRAKHPRTKVIVITGRDEQEARRRTGHQCRSPQPNRGENRRFQPCS